MGLTVEDTVLVGVTDEDNVPETELDEVSDPVNVPEHVAVLLGVGEVDVVAFGVDSGELPDDREGDTVPLSLPLTVGVTLFEPVPLPLLVGVMLFESVPLPLPLSV